MTRHYPDLGSVSDWWKQISRAARPIRNATQIWPMTRHQHGISALVSQTSFRAKTSGRVAKCLSSQDRLLPAFHKPLVSCDKFSFFLSLSDHCIFPLLLLFRSGTFGSMVEHGCEVANLISFLRNTIAILSLSCLRPC